jgi:ribonuclease T2
MRWLLIWVLTALPVWAENDKAGQFDYYVMALSLSPNLCEL